MANDQPKYSNLVVYLLITCSVLANVFFFVNQYLIRREDDHELSWSRVAAAEAERVASILCSGHGRAYVDGSLVSSPSDRDTSFGSMMALETRLNDNGNHPICECNTCYSGSDCSHFSLNCSADADSGEPLFLEPFWRKHASSSAVLISGWHRMGYEFPDSSYISSELERQIRDLHAAVGNAVTSEKFIIFGAGSTHVVNAALYALSLEDSSTPTGVVASTPYYWPYKTQTDLLKSTKFKWQGDASLWKNISNNSSMNFIELVTSPNNPDGKLMKSVLEHQQGLSVKTIYDHAYYWPHYSAIEAPSNEDMMVFTLSKLTGHGGSRFGWAIVKDKGVYERMTEYMYYNSLGVSRETQLRVLKLLKVVLKDGGREFFEVGHNATKNRWERLNEVVSESKRFSLQILNPQYCSYYGNITHPSPAYAWLKCEKAEEQDCAAVLRGASIIGHEGTDFNAEGRYVRLSLIKTEDDFEQLLQRMDALVSQELEGVGAPQSDLYTNI